MKNSAARDASSDEKQMGRRGKAESWLESLVRPNLTHWYMVTFSTALLALRPPTTGFRSGTHSRNGSGRPRGYHRQHRGGRAQRSGVDARANTGARASLGASRARRTAGRARVGRQARAASRAAFADPRRNGTIYVSDGLRRRDPTCRWRRPPCAEFRQRGADAGRYARASGAGVWSGTLYVADTLNIAWVFDAR